EMDRSREANAVKCIQRLDDDSFCLALKSIDAGAPRGEIPGLMVLVNGFFAKLEEDFESHGCVAIWIQQGTGSPTTWEALRSDYAGKTNPFQAPPHTIRGDAARGVLKVERVSILANVIHLSANEAEGHREVHDVWWSPGN